MDNLWLLGGEIIRDPNETASLVTHRFAGGGGFFDPMTTDTGRTKYVIGEFGAGLAVMLLGAYFWMRRGEVSGDKGEATAVSA